MAKSVFTIDAGRGFATTLVRGLIERLRPQQDPIALARAVIFLPTRRAVRALSDEFARQLDGAALLPDIRALGDVDEDELAFDPATEDLDLPPAIAPLRQRLLLAQLVRHWSLRRGENLSFAQATALANGLAAFLFEAQTAHADLGLLDTLIEGSLAAHWAHVRDFLLLLREAWPPVLAAEGAMDPAARRNVALAAVTRHMTQRSSGPVIAAGSTGSIPATAQLLSAIASLPNGAVILPDLDRELDDDSWNRLEEGHPQFGLKQLLTALDTDRSAVRDWQEPAERSARRTLIRQALLPAPTTDAWQRLAEAGSEPLLPGLKGLTLIEAATPAEEALVIALALRQSLETPNATAALVTPDRNLARRVAAELRRWDIDIDDSAGRPLAHTPPGEFLCLLSEAAESGFAPVALLALLKHPLAAGGRDPAQFRRFSRTLDRRALRGPSPDAGLAGIAARIPADLAPHFTAVQTILAPFAQLFSYPEVDLTEALGIHIAAGEALAASDRESGATRLWRGDAGRVAAGLLRDLQAAATALPAIAPQAYPSFFRELAREKTVRPSHGGHPRLFILGPLEARLQRFDVTILGGLNEASWPQTAANDAWLSRPMRRALGLDAPERSIGRAAHDFSTLACGETVLLTRALKADGAPTVASRWWQRLEQLTAGLGLRERLRDDTLIQIARRLDRPPSPAEPMPRPAPTPPVSARPRALAVTEIETWLRDPYAIYARHVLRLRPLDPLQGEFGPRERGIAIHNALERFAKEFPGVLPDGCEVRLVEIAEDIFSEIKLPQAERALWRPRFQRAAAWFVAEERRRRSSIARLHIEVTGQAEFEGPAGRFILRARADRIDELKAGGAAVVDYKSGSPPSNKQVTTLLAPQLPLEAAIL
ncbi:MAG: double-strand break repair protein AddB, partial [Alphaproteobacteria bacterium]|nr:double-strand break repair protein AddB [Alphaproteobacteria bacterium]